MTLLVLGMVAIETTLWRHRRRFYAELTDDDIEMSHVCEGVEDQFIRQHTSSRIIDQSDDSE